MLSRRQIDYELDYWRQAPAAKNEVRARRVLDLWKFKGAESVLEVGTGPYGGCLPYVEAARKVGCDPLYCDYAAAGIGDGYGDCEEIWICSTVEAIRRLKPFDAVLCMNTLDHGDSDFSAVGAIAKLLKPGGRFYLHVSLRTAEQLNEGHDHVMNVEDLYAAVKKSRLTPVLVEIYPRDPVEDSEYQTLVGVWEK